MLRSFLPQQSRGFSTKIPGLFSFQSEDVEQENEIRFAVQKLCEKFLNSYWRTLDEEGSYPSDFVNELGHAGFLHAMIPTQYGGSGQSLQIMSAILEEINSTGGNASAAHAQMYMLSSILRFGTEGQKQKYLPQFVANKLRFQAFGITESDSGSDTLSLKTKATKQSDGTWRIKGQKLWTSRALHSDLMLVLARTSNEGPRTKQLSTFLLDLNENKSNGLVSIHKIDSTINHNTCEVFFDDAISHELIGPEGGGFGVVLSVMNAERVLIASECIGDGRFFMNKAVNHVKYRNVFGNPLGKYQGIQFPLASNYINLESAALATKSAAKMWQIEPESSGPACMAAKHLASEASWTCADTCMQVHGGLAFDKKSDIERKWRETRLFRIAPISTNLILAHIGEKILGLPKSY